MIDETALELDRGCLPLERKFDLDRVFRLAYPKILSYAKKLARNPNDAADLTHETFVRAFKAIACRHQDTRIEPWLIRICYHCFLDSRRKLKSKAAPLSLETDFPIDSMTCLTDPAPNPEQHFLKGKLSEPIARALNNLPNHSRELLVMADLEGLSHKELASELGCGSTTIKTRIHRAHLAIRKELAGQHE